MRASSNGWKATTKRKQCFELLKREKNMKNLIQCSVPLCQRMGLGYALNCKTRAKVFCTCTRKNFSDDKDYNKENDLQMCIRDRL